jgi:hypothetical protein
MISRFGNLRVARSETVQMELHQHPLVSNFSRTSEFDYVRADKR